MITKTKSKNSDIKQFFNFVKSSNSAKKELIELAKSGKNKPNWNTYLGNAFRCYIKKSHPCYDSKFYIKIKQTKPEWLVSIKDKVKETKLLLLKMAKEGKDRPSCKTKLGRAFSSYVLKSSGSYDKSFAKEIKIARSTWLISLKDIHIQRKKILIEMAKNGKSRPEYTTPLGNFLCRYTNRNSRYYEKSFHNKLKKLSSEWFQGRGFRS